MSDRPVVIVVLDQGAAGAAIAVLRAYLHRPPFGDARTGDDEHSDAVERALEDLTEGLEDAEALEGMPRPQVWPGLAPGGLWRVVVDHDGRIIHQGPLLDGFAAEDAGTLDTLATIASRGSSLVFDGDSGILVARLRASAA